MVLENGLKPDLDHIEMISIHSFSNTVDDCSEIANDFLNHNFSELKCKSDYNSIIIETGSSSKSIYYDVRQPQDFIKQTNLMLIFFFYTCKRYAFHQQKYP